MNVFYDDGGAIGRRYARQDEAGTPFCVTIDFDTLGRETGIAGHRDAPLSRRRPAGTAENF